VRKAIAYLGTEQVAQVAIGLACRSNYDSSPGGEAAMKGRWSRLFQHGMTTAFAASCLAGQRNKSEQEAAFLGGLFHDVGQAVALRALEALMQTGQLDGAPSDEIIDEALHRIHAYPGDEFYEKWTLPESLMVICAQHHQLEELDGESRVLHYVSLASSFDSLLCGAASERRGALAQVRISADRLALAEAELSAAFTQTYAFGERSKRMFAS
jgi:HD-like signal output (HDOD) protein